MYSRAMARMLRTIHSRFTSPSPLPFHPLPVTLSTLLSIELLRIAAFLNTETFVFCLNCTSSATPRCNAFTQSRLAAKGSPARWMPLSWCPVPFLICWRQMGPEQGQTGLLPMFLKHAVMGLAC